jgi:preprotein translocase subunit YajC
MAVSARAIGQPDRNKHQELAVQVSNGKPGCTVTISGGKHPAVTTIGTDGTASATIDAEYQHGTATITAKTLRCKRAHETATTQVVLTRGEIHGNPWTNRGHRLDFILRSWRAHRQISVVATNGHNVQRFNAWCDDNGEVTIHFTPDVKGRWAVIVMQDGETDSITVDVR